MQNFWIILKNGHIIFVKEHNEKLYLLTIKENSTIKFKIEIYYVKNEIFGINGEIEVFTNDILGIINNIKV